MTLLGGLVPAMLTAEQEPPAPPHLGTADVDVILSVHLAEAKLGYETLEETLRRVGFEPDERSQGWRWFATVDRRRVRIDFLCDVDGTSAGHVIRPPGAQLLGALNVRGARYVAEDWTDVEIEGRLIDREGTVKVSVRVAGLEGYLLAKARAVLDRASQKDYYDFVYVLLYNRLGGPRAAAEALKHGKFADVVRSNSRMWKEIAARFDRADRVGVAAFAEESLRADPTMAPAQLRQDAVAAIAQFTSTLEDP